MKKALKVVGIVVLSLVAFVVVLLLTLPLWIGPVATRVANKVVPSYTGTDFVLGSLGLNYYIGKLHVGDVRLDNPSGYSPEQALTLGSLDVDVDMGTVLSDTIVIRDVQVKDVFVSITSEGGTNNFVAIAAHASSPAEKKDEAPVEEVAADDGNATTNAERKVVIDRIRIEGLVVQYGKLPIPLPTMITLTDIGRETGGIEFENAGIAIWDAIQKSATALSGGLINLGTGAFNQSTNLIGAGVEGAASAIGATGEVFDSGAQVLLDSAQGVGNALDKATDAVDSAAKTFKDVGKTFKNLFKK